MKDLLRKRFFTSIKKKGFTLIELSVVITIVAVLITGALAVSVTQIKNLKIDNTKERMDKIYAAMKIYIKANGALPCPAAITAIKSTSSTYGLADGTSGDCTDGGAGGVFNATTTAVVYGMVPVQDLGLSEDLAEDAFGSKFAYIVDQDFTTTIDYASNDLLTIQDSYGSATTRNISENAAFAIVSYGANKSGAYNANSSAQNTRSSNANEMENDLDGSSDFDLNLVSVSGWDSDFDDIVFFVDRDTLVVDSDAMSEVSCAAGTNSNNVSYDDGTTITVMKWPTAKYGQIVAANGPSSGNCPTGFTAGPTKPTKRCGAFGAWDDGAVSPCLENGNQANGGEPVAGTLACSGGIEDTSSVPDYTIHTFNSSSSLVCTGTGEIQYLIVAGGGGGGGVLSNEGGGGGGGGGGVTTGTYTPESDETITITVGTGGSGGTTGNGSLGMASLFGGYASATPGAGGLYGGSQNGVGGASGSGSQSSKSGGTPNDHDNDHVAGGGGASMVSSGGESTNHDGGSGGNGLASSITGTSITYGSGGGGGAGGGKSIEEIGVGGADSGGNGADDNTAAVAGVANRGGGGGGGAKDYTNGGAGGSGVIVVRYLTGGGGGGSDPCTGGAISYSGGNTIHTFTSSGSLVCTEAISNVSYLVVGAGGGGGGIIPVDGGKGGDKYGGGGGGGGGGVSTGTYNVGVETLTITIGSAGAGGNAANGSDGSISSIAGGLSVTSTGGSGGIFGPDQDGSENSGDAPDGGASGIGNTGSRAGGVANDEGKNDAPGAGGSSMANAGENVTNDDGGDGGDGTASDISGVSITYGSGGGGGTDNSGKSGGAFGVGGQNSGGDGADQDTAPQNGSKGGGGGGGAENYTTGGNGGDGIVIFSYTTP